MPMVGQSDHSCCKDLKKKAITRNTSEDSRPSWKAKLFLGSCEDVGKRALGQPV